MKKHIKTNHIDTKININSNSGPPEMDFSYFSPIEVKVNNNFDKAFKQFRTLVQSEGILALYKEKQSYEKPSVKKRRKHSESLRKVMEAETKHKKVVSGEYEKEKAKKLAKKEQKKKFREDTGNSGNG
jgi:ribosomal protein S21